VQGLLGENGAKDNARPKRGLGSLAGEAVVHPVLYSWREDLSSVVVRGLAVVCALVVLSIFSAWLYQKPAAKAVTPPQPNAEWIDVERPFPAFALTIPEAADVPSSYAIRRHVGGGRKDILTLGAPDGAAPFLQVEIYRPGGEPTRFGDIKAGMMTRAAALAPADVTVEPYAVDSKFGPLSVALFATGNGTPHACVAFERAYDAPRLQIFGWFCQGGAQFVAHSTLACALDRFSLLSAGSEPAVIALFAQAELRRSFCGQRSPLLAPTPKHTALWKAMVENAEPKTRR